MVLTAAAKVFSSSTQVDIYARLPYFMNPVLAACQMVNVAKPGEEPQLTEATEDMRLFAPELADKQGECWAQPRCIISLHLLLVDRAILLLPPCSWVLLNKHGVPRPLCAVLGRNDLGSHPFTTQSVGTSTHRGKMNSLAIGAS